MDLNTIETIRMPRSRSELTLAAGEAFMGGGSWLYSEPQLAVRGLVDLTALGWTPLETLEDDASDSALPQVANHVLPHTPGLRIAATCTLAELSRMPAEPDWGAHALFGRCCTALLGSFKVWNVATVGGNIALALPAGPMTALAVALDATLLVWTPTGEVTHRAADFVTGVRATLLQPGEVLRSIDIPARALRARTAYRQISLRPVGRSGALVIGRLDDDGTFALTVTAATPRPHYFSFERMPTAAQLHEAIDGVGVGVGVGDMVGGIREWYDDPHGAPDWRRAMTLRLAEEIRTELSSANDAHQHITHRAETA